MNLCFIFKIRIWWPSGPSLPYREWLKHVTENWAIYLLKDRMIFFQSATCFSTKIYWAIIVDQYLMYTVSTFVRTMQGSSWNVQAVHQISLFCHLLDYFPHCHGISRCSMIFLCIWMTLQSWGPCLPIYGDPFLPVASSHNKWQYFFHMFIRSHW